MRDYKFAEAEKFDPSYKTCADGLKTVALTETVKAFVSNMERVASLADFPINVVDISTTWARLGTQACLRLVSKPMLDQDDLQKDPDLMDKLTEEMAPLMKEWATKQLNVSEYAKSHEHAIKQLNGYLSLEDPVSGIEGILAALLTGTWTAFETMAGDLWVAALNAQPEGLAQLTGRPARIAKLAGETSRGDEDDLSGAESTVGPDESKVVRLNDIQALTHGDYDIRHKMGSLLRGRFKFVTLSGIRQAYSAAFSEQEQNARTASIDSALANKALDAMSIVRNIIIHKAMVADQEYVRKAKRCPLAPQIQAGDRLQLDGVICCTLISPVVAASVGLIKAVDTWLTLTSPAPTE
jgi:hypothetical protein